MELLGHVSNMLLDLPCKILETGEKVMICVDVNTRKV